MTVPRVLTAFREPLRLPRLLPQTLRLGLSPPLGLRAPQPFLAQPFLLLTRLCPFAFLLLLMLAQRLLLHRNTRGELLVGRRCHQPLRCAIIGGLAEALELTLLLVDGDPEKYERAASRWHTRFVQETPNVGVRLSQAVLALLVAVPSERLAAAALAELLSRRRSCERIAEALVRWSRAA